MLTWMSEEVGTNVGIVKLWGIVSVPFALPSSWARMRKRTMSVESCFKPLYDSTRNAVTTAEKRPAFE